MEVESYKVVFAGRAATGKTTMVINMIMASVHLGVDIYLFDPSIHNDPRWASVIRLKGIPPENCYTEFDEQVVKALFQRLRDNHDRARGEGTVLHTLIVFDGCKLPKDSPVLRQLITGYRCYCISVITTYQKLRDASQLMLDNCTVFKLR